MRFHRSNDAGIFHLCAARMRGKGSESPLVDVLPRMPHKN